MKLDSIVVLVQESFGCSTDYNPFSALSYFSMAEGQKKKRRSGGGQPPAPKKARTLDDYAVPSWLPAVKNAIDLLSTWMSVPAPF